MMHLSNHIGQRTTPSTVAFTDSAQRLVGIPAKRQVREQSIVENVFLWQQRNIVIARQIVAFLQPQFL